MLELIVLGEIPGTSFIITFAWAAALLSLFVAAMCMALIRRSANTSSRPAKLVEDITL